MGLEASEVVDLAGEGVIIEMVIGEAQRQAVQRWMAEMAVRAVRDRGEDAHERT